MTTDMTPARWAAIKKALDELLSMAPADREAFLCRFDESFRRDVTALLAVDARFLEHLLPTEIGEKDVVAEVLVGRYRIERALGSGGMGAVHLARDLLLDRPVAVKRLRDPWLAEADAMRSLVAEARALAALDHPHIARVQDVLETSPPALVMEFVEGRTLQAWLAEKQPAPAVLEALRQTVDAVAYAHRRGVVHCDLKPSNVLVTPDSEVKIIDFGIALMWSVVETVTSDATRLKRYTPRYAAPEVVRGATPSPASDVYSLGVLIEDVIEDCREAEAPLPVPLSEALARVARGCRVDDAAARPRDGAALAALLPTDVAVTVSRAHWRMVAVTTIVVCASCVAGGVAVVGDKVSASTTPVIAVVPRVDDGAAGTVSAGAADLLEAGLAPLTRARLVKGDVPPFRDNVPDLVKRLRDQGLSHVVIPTVSAFGGSGVRMSVGVYLARDGTIVKTFTRHGSRDAMATLARDVAAQIRGWLGEPTPVLPEITSTFQPSPEALEQYSQARHYSERPDRPGALEQARNLLEEVVSMQPAYAEAHAELARVLFLQYSLTPAPELVIRAQDALVEAQRHGGDLEEVLFGLAMAKQMTGRPDEAVPYLHRVLDRAPENDRALSLLGRIDVARGRAEAGLELLRRAVAVRPSFVNYRLLGTALYNEGRYDEASAAFERLAVLQSDNPWGYQMLGASYQMMGKDDLALAAYQRSLNLRRTAPALTNVATVLYERGDLAQAERYYAEAVALSPHNPVVQRNLGDVQLQRGRRDAAHETYGKALAAADALLKVNAGDAEAMGSASYVAARRGECNAALAYADRLAVIAPTSVRQLGNRANAYALCGRHATSAGLLKTLKARGRAPSAVLEKDVWKAIQELPEYQGIEDL